MVRHADLRERPDSAEARLRHLTEKHRDLERQLDQLQSRRWLSDDERTEAVRLKKMKLAVKDELESLQRRPAG